ncbi:AAA family ATPase [Caminibacter mediatlanticus]|uniref:Endonuclease GajA/Old nuclease/RecF-like AAA domain-containing protein n=1 Tax=Caminibacter mediatlanticus TB-2 TaxID=391592 RepID=A0AAI9AGV4_9BACT|nr:AAA family ATPase [Caminibacter mediatlanticus]EDM23272.1 hypothetical protein CMTB2_06226 [Caminibacter mediatlanticus TB-2]
MIGIKSLKGFNGIILKDELILNDLTIFMGDNSSGKSYTAILIDRIINIEEDPLSFNYNDYEKIFDKKLEVNNIVDSEKKDISLFLEKKILREKFIPILEDSLKDFFKNKVFLSLKLKKFDIKLVHIINDVKINIKIDKMDTFYKIDIVFNMNNQKLQTGIISNNLDKNIIIEHLLKMLSVFLIHISSGLKKSLYIPASRVGYLHTYQILGTFALSNLSKNINNIDLPPWILDFIIKLFIPPKKIIENDFSSFIEKDILKGEVKIDKESNNIEFYVSKNKKIPLSLTSSSISELIPLVVLLKKGFIEKNNLLIIEEPEAHLDFKNKIKFVELIKILMDYGVKILITTHSEFIINELNIKILNKEIDFKKVALYNFIRNSKRTNVFKVEIGKEGIDSSYINKYISNQLNRLNKAYESLDDA